MVPALQPPLGVVRDGNDALHVRLGEHLGNNERGPVGDSSQAAFLPSGDDSPDRLVVFDRRARMGESEPPSAALAAAPDGPGSRGAAARAERRSDSPQADAAALADLRAR